MANLQGRFRFVPDPPVAGRPLEVTYVGTATEVEFQVDGRKPLKMKPDKDGKLVVDPVPGGNELMFSDGQGIEGYAHRRITHVV